MSPPRYFARVPVPHSQHAFTAQVCNEGVFVTVTDGISSIELNQSEYYQLKDALGTEGGKTTGRIRVVRKGGVFRLRDQYNALVLGDDVLSFMDATGWNVLEAMVSAMEGRRHVLVKGGKVVYAYRAWRWGFVSPASPLFFTYEACAREAEIRCWKQAFVINSYVLDTGRSPLRLMHDLCSWQKSQSFWTGTSQFKIYFDDIAKTMPWPQKMWDMLSGDLFQACWASAHCTQSARMEAQIEQFSITEPSLWREVPQPLRDEGSLCALLNGRMRRIPRFLYRDFGGTQKTCPYVVARAMRFVLSQKMNREKKAWGLKELRDALYRLFLYANPDSRVSLEEAELLALLTVVRTWKCWWEKRDDDLSQLLYDHCLSYQPSNGDI